MFTECSGECCVCACGGGCLAGHGDDDFSPATKEQIIERLDKGQYKECTEYMKMYLKSKYNYDYQKKFDRNTALAVLSDISHSMYPSFDIFGNKTLVISRSAFEVIRKKYLD